MKLAMNASISGIRFVFFFVHFFFLFGYHATETDIYV